MVQADALDIDMLAIEKKSSVIGKLNTSDPQRCGVCIHRLPPHRNGGDDLVHIRCIRRPKLRLSHRKGLLKLMHRSRLNALRRVRVRNGSALRIHDYGMQRDACSVHTLVRDFSAQLHGGNFFGNFRRGDVGAPLRNVHGIDRGQPYAAIDTRARIPPAAVRLHIDANRHDVLFVAVVQVGGQVVTETYISIGSMPQQMSIDPHLTVHVDPIEVDKDPFPPALCRHGECLPIPTNTTGQVAHRVTARHLGIEGQFNTPVMRHIQRAPV